MGANVANDVRNSRFCLAPAIVSVPFVVSHLTLHDFPVPSCEGRDASEAGARRRPPGLAQIGDPCEFPSGRQQNVEVAGAEDVVLTLRAFAEAQERRLQGRR